MAVAKDTILEWLDCARRSGASHMLVVCDTYDWEDYPVSVLPGEDPMTAYKKYSTASMQKVMEVYNLRMDIEKQLLEHRSFNF